MGHKHNHFGWRDLVLVIPECSQSTFLVFKSPSLSFNDNDIEGANSSIDEALNMIGTRHD